MAQVSWFAVPTASRWYPRGLLVVLRRKLMINKVTVIFATLAAGVLSASCVIMVAGAEEPPPRSEPVCSEVFSAAFDAAAKQMKGKAELWMAEQISAGRPHFVVLPAGCNGSCSVMCSW